MPSTDGHDEPQFDEVVDSLDRFERTIDVQISLMNELDEKASNVVRYTALLLGGIFTALSLLPRSDAVSLDSVGPLPTIVFLLGTASLVVAIVAAIITYLSSVQEYGPDPAYGDNVADRAIQSPDYEAVLLSGYTRAVDNNRRVIDVNARRFRWSLLALLVGSFIPRRLVGCSSSISRRSSNSSCWMQYPCSSLRLATLSTRKSF